MKIAKPVEPELAQSENSSRQDHSLTKKLPLLTVLCCSGVILVLGVCVIYNPRFDGGMTFRFSPVEFLLNKQSPK